MGINHNLTEIHAVFIVKEICKPDIRIAGDNMLVMDDDMWRSVMRWSNKIIILIYT